MNSGFSGKKLRQIPKNLNECMSADSTVSNLKALAEALESWGSGLFKILIIWGVAASIGDTIEVNDTLSEPSVVTLIFTLISSLVQWGIYAIIEYCVYRVLALLTSSLATITENTTICANVALLQASANAQDNTAGAPAPAKHTQTQPTATKKESKENTSSGSVWICSACGTQNLPETNICRACRKEK